MNGRIVVQIKADEGESARARPLVLYVKGVPTLPNVGIPLIQTAVVDNILPLIEPSNGGLVGVSYTPYQNFRVFGTEDLDEAPGHWQTSFLLRNASRSVVSRVTVPFTLQGYDVYSWGNAMAGLETDLQALGFDSLQILPDVDASFASIAGFKQSKLGGN